MNCVLTIEVTNSTGSSVSFNTLPFVPPKDMQLPPAKVTAAVVSDDVANDGGSVAGEIQVNVSTTATALYVVLTTLANGRFSDNAFLLEASSSPRAIQFVPFAAAKSDPAATLALLKSSLRVEHLAENM